MCSCYRFFLSPLSFFKVDCGEGLDSLSRSAPVVDINTEKKTSKLIANPRHVVLKLAGAVAIFFFSSVKVIYCVVRGLSVCVVREIEKTKISPTNCLGEPQKPRQEGYKSFSRLMSFP